MGNGIPGKIYDYFPLIGEKKFTALYTNTNKGLVGRSKE